MAPGLGDLGSQKDPKKVPDSVFDDDADLSKLGKTEIVEVIASVLQGVFYVIAGALKHDHWLLNNRDAVELAKAAWECLKTLPSKKNKAIEKWLKENAPWVKLLVVGASIVGSRAATSLQIAQLEKQNNELRSANITGERVGPGGFGPAGTDPILSDEFIT